MVVYKLHRSVLLIINRCKFFLKELLLYILLIRRKKNPAPDDIILLVIDTRYGIPSLNIVC